MTMESGFARRHGRIGAAVLILFAVLFGVAGSVIPYAFSSDPLGPRVFPVALAAILAGLSLLYMLRPGAAEAWPAGRTLLGAAGIPALVAACALMLEPLGFAAAIFVLTAGIARLFGAAWSRALPAAVAHAIFWYVVFGYLLEVQLPLGTLWRGLGR